MSEEPNSVSGSKTLRLLLIGSALFLATVLIVRWVQSSKQVATVIPAKTSPVIRAEPRVEHAVVRETASVVPAAIPRVQTPATHFVSTEIAAAFPGLTEVTNDWRQFRPEMLTVAPHPDLPITFNRLVVKDEGKYVTWIGRNPQMPGASFVGVATVEGYDAVLVIPGASHFSFHVRGDSMVIMEAGADAESCGVAPVQYARAPIESGASVVQISYASGFDPDASISAATPALHVDVLFAYDASALAAAGSSGAGFFDGTCKALIESANVDLSQSGVTNFAWRYLGVVAAPAYTRSGNIADDLHAMAPGGVLADWIKTTRYQRGADQIMLMVGSTVDFIGRAYNPQQTAVTRDLAVAVMTWNGSTQTLAHELAHNFGCQHDRAHVNVNALNDYGPAVPDNDGFWCYGLMWQNPPLPPGYSGTSGTGGTVMSYADWRIPYFSNPNITVHLTGSLLGWSVNPDMGTRQIGVAETAPGAAYNAKVLSDQALTMSNLSEEIVMPVITQQPQSPTVITGQSFSLSVTASGGGLSYQWLKNGAAIGGAQTSTYSKVADASEPGSYSVTVSNLAGSVTSNTATITVIAPPPVNSGNGGGGGGGGIPSAGFLAVFSLLGFARARRTRLANISRS